MTTDDRVDVLFVDLDGTLWSGTWLEESTAIHPQALAALDLTPTRGIIPVALTTIATPDSAEQALRANGIDPHRFAAVMAHDSPKVLRAEKVLSRIKVPWKRVGLVDDDPIARLDFASRGAATFESLEELISYVSDRPSVSSSSVDARMAIRKAGFELVQTATGGRDLRTYLRGVGLRVSVDLARNDAELHRAAELLHRTTQLHLNPSRFQGAESVEELTSELTSLVGDGHQVWVAHVALAGLPVGIQGCWIYSVATGIVIDLTFSCSVLPFRVVEPLSLSVFAAKVCTPDRPITLITSATESNQRIRWVLEDLGGLLEANGNYTLSRRPQVSPFVEWLDPGGLPESPAMEDGIPEVGAFFDRWAKDLVEEKSSGVVLDIGYGFGEILGPARNRRIQQVVAERGGALIRGDIDPRDASVTWMDVEHLTSLSSAAVDAVLCFELLEHVTYPDQAISEVLRVLKVGGLLVLSTPGPAYPYHAFQEDHSRFTSGFLGRLLGRCGRIIHIDTSAVGDLEYRTTLCWSKTADADSGEVRAAFAEAAAETRLLGGLVCYM